MRDFLVTKLGFKDKDIKTLVNQSATEANIKQWVRDWLINGTQAGDRVFFSYSGHGSRVPDISGDEIYDHMDELIAVYDVTLKEPIIDGEPVVPVSGYILDDEISRWIASLFGRQVVMLFDSYNSGTIAKLLTKGGNGEYQVPQVEIYGYEESELPILAGLPDSGWTTALETDNPISPWLQRLGKQWLDRPGHSP